MRLAGARLFAVVTISFVCGLQPAAAFDFGFAKEDGGQSGSIFDFAASARSVGMGHAHVGVAEDASATYWNPAGLTQVDRQDLVADYSALQQETGFGFVSYAHPTMDWGTFGWSVISLRSQNFQKRDSIGQSLGSFDQSETALLFSNGSYLRDNLSWGFTLKGVRQEIDAYDSTAVGADVGLMLNSNRFLQTGLTFRNAWAPRLKLRSETETMAREGRLGFRLTPGRHFTLALDVAKVERRDPKIFAGTEWTIGNSLALRAGLNETELTAGVGVQLKDWGFDYALGYHDAAANVEDFGASHRFGVHIQFGSHAREDRMSLKWQRKGRVVLDLLDQQVVAVGAYALPYDSTKLIEMGRQVINHQGFTNARDLYMAQGYMYYLKGDSLRSLQSLSEAASLDPDNNSLASNIVKIRSHLNEEHTREIVEAETRQMLLAIEQEDHETVVKSAKRILSLAPEDMAAQHALEISSKRLREPFDAQMKLAKEKYSVGDYLGAIRHLTTAKELDANSREVTQYMEMSLAELERKSTSQAADKIRRANRPHLAVYQVPTPPEPDRSKEFYSQGLLLYSQGRLQEASEAWKEATKLDDTNVLARNAYNRSLSELKGEPSK